MSISDARVARLAVVLGLAIVVLAQVPYLLAYLARPPGTHFLGHIFNVPDHAAYAMIMQQAAEGRLSWIDWYWPGFPGVAPPAWFWGGVGWIAGHLSLPVIVVYHLVRVLSSAAYLFFLWKLMGRWTPNPRARLLAYALAGGSLGLGVFAHILHVHFTSLDLAMPEVWGLTSITIFPHMAFNLALLCLALWQFEEALREPRAWVHVAVSALAAFLLGVVHPTTAAPLAMVLTVMVVVLAVTRQGFARVGEAVVVIAACAAGAAWTSLAISHSPLQPLMATITFPPSRPAGYLLGYGVVGVAALWALVSRQAFRPRPPSLLPAVWLVMLPAMVFSYARVPISGRFVIGAFLPLCALAAPALFRLVEDLQAKSARTALKFALIVVLVPAPLGYAFRDASHPAAYVSDGQEAMWGYLACNVPEGDIIFCERQDGQYIGAYAERWTFDGHWHLSPHDGRRHRLAEEFFRGTTSPARRQEILLASKCAWIAAAGGDAMAVRADPVIRGWVTFSEGDAVVARVPSTSLPRQ
jgi:hypothetical protein